MRFEGGALAGRLALVTGAGGGIGRSTASRFAQQGADLVLVDRDAGALSAAQDGCAGGGGTRPFAIVADPAELTTIDALADRVLALDRPVDIVVAADEIVAVPFALDRFGIESQMAYNGVANAVLVSRLSPALRGAEAGRFVILGSVAHQLAAVRADDLGYRHHPYDPWIAYAASKTAAGLVALKLFRELTDEAYSTTVVHPGALAGGDSVLPPLLAAVPRFDEHDGALWRRAAAALDWAATAPAAFARYSYADGAGASTMLRHPNGSTGHMPHIGDVDTSEALWSAIERHLGRPLRFDR